MFELIDEIGCDEIKLLQEMRNSVKEQATASTSEQLHARVHCTDVERELQSGFNDSEGGKIVECSRSTLSKIESLGLVQSVKGQGYEEARGPGFCMAITERGYDLLSRSVFVWLVSRFSAKMNKWLAFITATLVGLSSVLSWVSP